jgi:hypothetical protein
MCEEDAMIPTERIGLTVWILLNWDYTRHGPPSTHALATEIGVTENGMWRMLDKLSRVIPVAHVDGGWQISLPRVSSRQS